MVARFCVLCLVLGTAACGGLLTDSETATASFSLHVVLSGEAGVSAMDQGRVYIEGPTTIPRFTMTPGETRTISDLRPGVYTVSLEGLSSGEVVRFGETTNVTVTAGVNTPVTVVLHGFVPELHQLPATVEVGANVEVRFNSVFGANEYTVEVDENPDFPDPRRTTTASTSVQIQLESTGVHHIRVRAQNRFGSAGQACTPVTVAVTEAPAVGVTPSSLSFSADVGTNPNPKTFTVTNTGGGRLDWSATESVSWLSLSPGSGSLGAGESQSVTVSPSCVDTNPGQYSTDIAVADPEATNSPQTVFVGLTCTEVAGVRVSGTVYYSTTPLEGVKVELSQGSSHNPIQTGFTDGNGEYQFLGVPAGDDYRVMAIGDEYGSPGEYSSFGRGGLDITDADLVQDIYLPKNLKNMSPPDGSTVGTTNPTLTWDANPEASAGGYYVTGVYLDDPWTSIESGGSGTSTSYTVQTALTFGETYTWTTGGWDSNGHRVAIGWSSFTVAAAQGYMVSGRVYYSTTPLAGVEVRLGQGPTNTPAIQTVYSDSNGDYQFLGVPAGEDYWVYANGSDYGSAGEYIPGIYYSRWDITDSDVVKNIYLPKTLSILSPSDGSSVSTVNPTLTWESNPEVQAGGQYRIYVYTSDYTLVHSGTSSTTSHTVPTNLTPGDTYNWLVYGYDSAGHNVASSGFHSFTVTSVP